MKLQPKESNFPLPYAIQTEEGKIPNSGFIGYYFITGDGSEYWVTFYNFTDTFLVGYNNPIRGSLYEFSFGVKGEQRPSGGDPKVRATLIHLLQNFFEDNPESALSYVCDNADGKGAMRLRLFRLWFQLYRKTISSPLHSEYFSAGQNPPFKMALIIRKDNLGRAALIEHLKHEVPILIEEKESAES